MRRASTGYVTVNSALWPKLTIGGAAPATSLCAQVSAEPAGAAAAAAGGAHPQPCVVPKPEEVREKIRALVRSTLLFKGGCGAPILTSQTLLPPWRAGTKPFTPPQFLSFFLAELDEEQEGQVIDAMFERKVEAGEPVIRCVPWQTSRAARAKLPVAQAHLHSSVRTPPLH